MTVFTGEVIHCFLSDIGRIADDHIVLTVTQFIEKIALNQFDSILHAVAFNIDFGNIECILADIHAVNLCIGEDFGRDNAQATRARA